MVKQMNDSNSTNNVSNNSVIHDVKIREFSIDDYDAVMNLWHVCELPVKPTGRDSREKIMKELSNNTANFLVAELNGQVIGTVLATNDGRKGWINRLAVLPAFQHMGIARLLLEKAENILDNLGLEILTCLIEDHNSTSMNFFQKSGYIKHTDIIYFSKRKYPGV
jgi:N-acetylglutamate synthase